eukprot:808350-Rhodomonas_salina.1
MSRTGLGVQLGDARPAQHAIATRIAELHRQKHVLCAALSDARRRASWEQSASAKVRHRQKDMGGSRECAPEVARRST